MADEQGMKIDYDVVTKQTRVSFRGDRITLPGLFPTLEAATQAGEEFCRGRGWKS